MLIWSLQVWKQLLVFDPPFRPSGAFLSALDAGDVDVPKGNGDSSTGKSKLDKKHHQAIQAAVSELYFLQKYAAVQEIITWAKEHFEKDKKWDAQVVKWEGKIKEKMSAQEVA